MKKENIQTIPTSKRKKQMQFTFFAVMLIIIFSVAITPVSLQNDTFYTIKIGEHIAQNGIDRQDPFSWHDNLPYTYPHWLYDLITYGIYTLFGMTGIYVTTCILSAILGLSIYWVNNKLAKNQLFSFILTIGVMYLLRDYIAARAQLVTFILFILTIYFIEKFLQTKQKRYAIPLLLIPILIANMHLAVFPFYFVLFLPYIGEYILVLLADTILYQKLKIAMIKVKMAINEKKGKTEKVEQLKATLASIKTQVDKIKIKRAEELKNPYKIKLTRNDTVRYLIVIMLLAVLTGFLTPLGTTPYTYLFKTLQGNTTQNINEHLPMTLGDETEILCVLVVVLSILIFTKSKIRLSDLFMIGGLSYLMLRSKRQVTMFLLIGSVILNRSLMQIVEIYFKETGKEKLRKFTDSIIVTMLLTLLILYHSYNFAKPKWKQNYVNQSDYPVDACEWILQNIDLKQAKFYNEYNYGSYMLFKGIPVFIDSRADLYAPEFNETEDIFMDFINTSNIGTFYEDTFEKYGITHVINYKNSKMVMIIQKTKDTNYKLLYEDDRFVIYERLQ